MNNKRTIALILSIDTNRVTVDEVVTRLAAETSTDVEFVCGSFCSDVYYFYIEFSNCSDEEVDEFSFKLLDEVPIVDFVSAA